MRSVLDVPVYKRGYFRLGLDGWGMQREKCWNTIHYRSRVYTSYSFSNAFYSI